MKAISKKTNLVIDIQDFGKDTFSGVVITADDFYKVGNYSEKWYLESFEIVDEIKPIVAPNYYDNTNGSLYEFAELQGLNSWEFDICKRIIRCRKKGNFIEDLEKTKFLIDLYLKEYKEC